MTDIKFEEGQLYECDYWKFDKRVRFKYLKNHINDNAIFVSVQNSELIINYHKKIRYKCNDRMYLYLHQIKNCKRILK